MKLLLTVFLFTRGFNSETEMIPHWRLELVILPIFVWPCLSVLVLLSASARAALPAQLPYLLHTILLLCCYASNIIMTGAVPSGNIFSWESLQSKHKRMLGTQNHFRQLQSNCYATMERLTMQLQSSKSIL